MQRCISEYEGKRIAIDASGWVHKAVYAVAEDYVDANLQDHQFYVDYILNKARALMSLKIIPVFVFDGPRNSLKVRVPFLAFSVTDDDLFEISSCCPFLYQ
jgi:5'-3' exonuclease